MHEHFHLFDFRSPSRSRGWLSPFQILGLSVLGPPYGQQLPGKKHSVVMRGCRVASAPHGTGISYMRRSVLSMGCIPCKTITAGWCQVNRSMLPGGTRLSQAQFTEERARQTLVRHSAALPPAALCKHPHAISTQAVCCGMLAAV
jgi:hypothetical protein